jgi:hypothetical protein
MPHPSLPAQPHGGCPHTPTRRVRRVLALPAASLALVALLVIAASPSLAAASPSYVALGDSYTAGPLILPPALGAPLECLQSARNYSHLTERRGERPRRDALS